MRRSAHSSCAIWALLAVAGVASAAEPVFVRQGDGWLGTITGSEAIRPTGTLRIESRGAVLVSGMEGSRVAWEFQAHVKTRDEAAARARFNQMSIQAFDRGDELYLLVNPGSLESRLRVAVPRTLSGTRVALVDGAVEAYALAGSVAVSTGGGAVKADGIGGSFSARTGGGEIRLGEVAGAVRCATGGGAIHARLIRGDAALETGAGDIDVDEVRGAARCSTGGGAVKIARAGAGVIVMTGGGPVDVGAARGLVEIRNSGGPVRVGAASGVRCEAAAGAIRLANVSGSLRASTAIGSILAQLLAGPPLGDSFLTTGRGDITVIIPSNVGVKILAENEMHGAGRAIVSDFPGILTRVAGGRAIAEGVVNGGGPLLRISGTGGIIFIKRQ